MKRLVSSIQGGIVEQALKEIYEEYNTEKLYVDYNDLNEKSLVDSEMMHDYYDNYNNDITNEDMDFYDWEQEVLKNGDLEEFTAEWIENYILNETPELIKRDFPTIYKYIK